MQMKEVYGQDEDNLEKVELVNIDFFISEYEGKPCIGISTKDNEVGIKALCDCLGIELEDFAVHLKAMVAAFGRTFSETIEELSTIKDTDVKGMN